MKSKEIDNGKEFDWGRVSDDYARYRDIYPEEFFKMLADEGIGIKGQKVIDLGTGTGVLPRGMYKYGADFVGIDISENQTEQARRIAKEQDQDIEFICMPAEKLKFKDDTFDAATACQCFWYFDHEAAAPELYRVLKEGGRFAVLFIEWLPYESRIAYETEQLVLKYNPEWTGAGYKREYENIGYAKPYLNLFEIEKTIGFDTEIPFTYETWNGRIKACRGIGASLTKEKIREFEEEHLKLLKKIAPEKFSILHYVYMIILRAKT